MGMSKNLAFYIDRQNIFFYHRYMASEYIKKRVLEEIAEARKKGPPYRLELIKLQLGEIPKEVLEYDDWESLDFSSDAVLNNNNCVLDEEYWWEVSFDNNEIGKIPSEIGSLKKLKELTINQNYIYRLPPELSQCISLKRLTLRNNFIQALPPEIGSLRNLEYLDLSFNSIPTLPPEIGELSGLKHLDLRANDLTSLPPEIGSLDALEYLDIGNYPEDEMFNDTIERFELQRNRIKELPVETADLSNLSEFYCEGNPLEYPPAEDISPDDFRALYWYFGRAVPEHLEE